MRRRVSVPGFLKVMVMVTGVEMEMETSRTLRVTVGDLRITRTREILKALRTSVHGFRVQVLRMFLLLVAPAIGAEGPVTLRTSVLLLSTWRVISWRHRKVFVLHRRTLSLVETVLLVTSPSSLTPRGTSLMVVGVVVGAMAMAKPQQLKLPCLVVLLLQVCLM
jgi:hypothetical protein